MEVLGTVCSCLQDGNIKASLQTGICTCRKDRGNPAAVAVIQTFGDYLASGPHMHILAADGCFSGDGFFYAPGIDIDTESLEKLFIHKIFKLLLSKGLITKRTIELISYP